MRYPWNKLAKYARAHDQCAIARAEAYDNGIPYTPYPLKPWILKNIQRRHAETGERTRTTPARGNAS